MATAGPPATSAQGPAPAERFGIDAAQAFVVLLSASFLSSSRCAEELASATQRQQQLLSAGHGADFIYVLRVGETPDLSGSGLEAYGRIDLTQDSEWAREVSLSRLGGSILSRAWTTGTAAELPVHIPTGQKFLDRAEELERVLYTVSSSAGPHFWLVISPPGLGKSRFLRQLAAKAGESPTMKWEIRTVDLRHGEPRPERDALAVVRELFGLEEPAPPSADDELRGVAQRIIRSGRPWLCTLDSAELLSPAAVAELRQHLGKIYQSIQRTTGARLAFVAASQRDDRWRGLTPYPGLSVLPLSGFGAATVRDALEELARRATPQMVRSPNELRDDAARVERLTEGMPALVRQTLGWIQEQDWLDIDRLDSQQLFDDVVAPYVRDELLDGNSLFPGEDDQPPESDKRLEVLREALGVLAPYRLFTRYHVQEQLGGDGSFATALKDAKWTIDDLWQAIAGTALLYRPLDEPWQELHPVVRRLLCRYFYPAEDDRAKAHQRARDFSLKWAGQLTGKEQVVGMVEAIWHEAAASTLKPDGAVPLGDDLTSFARKLSFDINSHSYSQDELREYAAERMRNDDELQREVAGPEARFEQLVRAVRKPEST